MESQQNEMDKLVTVVMLGFGGVLLLVGLLWFGIAISASRKAAKSKSWPTAQATITQSTIEQSTIRVKRQGDKPFYKPIIRYKYAVDGASFNGDQIATAHPDGSTDRSWATQITSRYPLNAVVQVQYDPDNHDYAVLESGSTGQNSFFFLIAAISGILGLGMAIFGLILRAKQKAT